MRLLNARTYRLETYPDHSVRPRYAILSHTWGEEEVTFQDVEAASPPTHMLGYKKVIGTCHQALDRGLDYVWVDTCCIDKTSSTELSMAINSMYQWYQDAEICFAYLSDVPFAPQNKWRQNANFVKSRWFERGWTLQELLGPKHIIFFSRTWDEIGDRTSLSPSIGTATRIDAKFLAYNGREYLAEASIAEKMDWAATRKTSVVEDEAYCLLGIFGINMPLLYGEGRNAFLRLQEELIRRSDDQSIFAWGCNSNPFLLRFKVERQGVGVLAESPAAFVGCSWIEYRGRNSHRQPYSLLNTGISIKAPCSVGFTWADDEHSEMMLRCGPKDDPTSVMTLPIRRIQDRGEFFSRERAPCRTLYSTCMRWKPKLITLSVQHDDDSSQGQWLPRSTPVWVKTIPPAFFFTEFHPPAKWTQARVVQVPAPGRSAFKPFCRIKHRDSGAEITLVLINRPRFQCITRWMMTEPVSRIKIILLPSAEEPETYEVGTSHCVTWSGGKKVLYTKTSYEPTMDGPLLVLSIDERDAKHRNWILVHDAFQQTVIDLVDIFKVLNGKMAQEGLHLCQIGAILSLAFYAVCAEAGYARPQSSGWELPSMSRESARYFHLVVTYLLVFSFTGTFTQSRVSLPMLPEGGVRRPLVLLAVFSALAALDAILPGYIYVWATLLLLALALAFLYFNVWWL